MNILFIDADNSKTSGAFRSMLVLNELLNAYDNIRTCIIVLKNGITGNETCEELLKNTKIQ